jgi:nucleotide-binding universal stress UspA family protein
MNASTAFHPSRILCPVDFSELSDLALKYAAAGARVYDATLVVFHAAQFELPVYFTSSQVRELARQHRAGQKQAADFLRRHVRKLLGKEAGQLRLQFDTSEAHPVDAILAAARKHRVDLIVMGTHGRSGAKRLWLGSATENVVRQADVPVFVVRQKQHEFINASDPRTAPGLAMILCPVNFTEASRAALQHAASLARQFKAQLIAPCILEPGDQRKTPETRRRMVSWLKAITAEACDAQVMTQKGQAANQIVSLAAAKRVDLVVLGAQHHGSFQNWFAGDTAEIVLRHAPAPVLVVPS